MLTFRLCQRRFALKGFADASPEFLLCGPLRPLRLCGEEICHCRETQRYAEIRRDTQRCAEKNPELRLSRVA
jgi:hypothetical protein